jgi:hypothetical protein
VWSGKSAVVLENMRNIEKIFCTLQRFLALAAEGRFLVPWSLIVGQLSEYSLIHT